MAKPEVQRLPNAVKAVGSGDERAEAKITCVTRQTESGMSDFGRVREIAPR